MNPAGVHLSIFRPEPTPRPTAIATTAGLIDNRPMVLLRRSATKHELNATFSSC
ncbi:hypothetical protein I547_1946 [Mycobacterium kansasii 824]|uniref:Uncharacterized protein n=1 Tax=Mycobacterium kansasii TaxID=1768 RepID=A0A1V3WSZ8_MYCKA|nr:hypothetical protein I547_1946 [Mycobacterium kansasii 824]KEP44190.1 hypothetical protein MKSMC1_05510 [Mycobacterium kansasii]OOK69878.1 hypothetical protein BZL29_6315 [Mycobacterium kansasii]